MFYLSELDIVLHLNLKDAFYEQYDSCHEESVNFEGLSRCSKLETILLPSNIKSVSFNAFVDCINLKEVQIVDSLSNIQDKMLLNYLKMNLPISFIMNLGISTLGINNLLMDIL